MANRFWYGSTPATTAWGAASAWSTVEVKAGVNTTSTTSWANNNEAIFSNNLVQTNFIRFNSSYTATALYGNAYMGDTTLSGSAVSLTTLTLGANGINFSSAPAGVTSPAANNLTITGNMRISLASVSTIDTYIRTINIGVPIIGASGGINKYGTGTLALNAANTYGGATVLYAGTLNLGDNSSLGTSVFSISGGTIDVTSTRTISNTTIIYNPFTFAGTANLTMSGSITLSGSPTVTVNANTLTFSNAIGESGIPRTLTKAGNGTLSLTAYNSYTGGTIVNGGTLYLGASTNNNGIIRGSLTLNSGATLNIGGSDSFGNYAGPGMVGVTSLTATSATINQQTGFMTLPNGTYTLNNSNYIVDNSGVYLTLYSGSAPCVIASSGASSIYKTAGSCVINLQQSITQFAVSSGALTVSLNMVPDVLGNIPNGAILKTGAGTLILSGANTYIGGTTLSAGTASLGTSQIASTSGPLGASGTITLSGGAIQYSSVNQTDYSSRFSTSASQQYNVDTNSQDVTWASNLISSGGSLSKTGAGTLTVTGTNTYSGGTTLSAGTIKASSSTALGEGNTSVSGGQLHVTVGSYVHKGNVTFSGGNLKIGGS
jgi:fibronectin-binding autotransporter adhesin